MEKKNNPGLLKRVTLVSFREKHCIAKTPTKPRSAEMAGCTSDKPARQLLEEIQLPSTVHHRIKFMEWLFIANTIINRRIQIGEVLFVPQNITGKVSLCCNSPESHTTGE
jgi:hypothetical protein